MTDSEPRPSHHPATAWVDLGRIRDNFRAIRTYAGTRAVIPVIKANAYGHGSIEVARALEPMGVTMFAVAYVDEGIVLRKAGIKTPILILTGFTPAQLQDILAFDLTPVISTPEQVSVLEAVEPETLKGLSVHVKVDTGMSRLGFSLREIEPVIHRLEDIESLEIEGLMTHLASADEDGAMTERQFNVFDEAIVRLQTLGVRPRLIHAANSAGMAGMRSTHTAVRPGLLLYGVKTLPLCPDIEVSPAMELRTRVALIKTIDPGTPVSYGGHFVASRPTRLATINAGYADGIPRTAAMRQGGALRFGGLPLPVAGTVCMDLTMLDATDVPELKVGDEVTVFGNAPSAWEVAGWAGTNAWEILTSVGPRVPRRYKA
ncbi:MAG: alanine racemase [Vicinamibacteria bacterium]